MYWAGFVYYGVPVDLSGSGALTAEDIADVPTVTLCHHEGATSMSDRDDPNDPSLAQPSAASAGETRDTAPVSTQRQASYYAEAAEVCPRCLAEDYLPVRGEPGLRQCVSCGQIYRPEEMNELN